MGCKTWLTIDRGTSSDTHLVGSMTRTRNRYLLVSSRRSTTWSSTQPLGSVPNRVYSQISPLHGRARLVHRGPWQGGNSNRTYPGGRIHEIRYTGTGLSVRYSTHTLWSQPTGSAPGADQKRALIPGLVLMLIHVPS